MPRFTRYYLPGHCYFVTSVTRDRVTYFSDPQLARLAVANLQFYRKRGDFLLHAYVIMPDHIHLLLTPLRGSISDVMRNLKSFIARQVSEPSGHTAPIWQSSFHDRVIRHEEHLMEALDYIHNNPVLARIVTKASDFPFSSAGSYESAAAGGWIDRLASCAPVRAGALTYE